MEKGARKPAIVGLDHVQLAMPAVRRCYALDPFGNRIEFIQEGGGFGR